MKAIFSSYYNGRWNHLVHTDVTEVQRTCANREFRCLHCGQQWTESINSPQIISEDVEKNFDEYYPHNVTYCEQPKK